MDREWRLGSGGQGVEGWVTGKGVCDDNFI